MFSSLVRRKGKGIFQEVSFQCDPPVSNFREEKVQVVGGEGLQVDVEERTRSKERKSGPGLSSANEGNGL